MSHWDRLKTAFVVTVICVGIAMVVDMIFSLHIENLVFGPELVVPVFVVAYLVAPLIGKYVKYK